jgi:hypothetical protein
MDRWKDCDAVERHPETLGGHGCFGEHVFLWLLYLKISGMVPQSISFSSGFQAYNALKSKPSSSTKRWLQRTLKAHENSL